MATPKIIPYQVKLRSTTIERSLVRPVVYTNDLRSAEFQFQVTDMQAGELSGATATTLLYMRDGSFFQNPKEDVELTGTTFSYLLKEDEGNHAGIARIQLVVRFNEGLEDEQNFPSQLYDFEIINGLETQVAQVAQQIMIHDWTALTREARTFIDTSSDEVDALKGELQTAINTANASLGEFDVALETGIVAANLAEKLEDFEEINNSRLLSTERQLADKVDKIDMVDVHSFLCSDGQYVKGDGVHDDLTGLRDAIAYCMTNKKKLKIRGDGKYFVSQPIHVAFEPNQNLEIEGDVAGNAYESQRASCIISESTDAILIDRVYWGMNTINIKDVSFENKGVVDNTYAIHFRNKMTDANFTYLNKMFFDNCNMSYFESAFHFDGSESPAGGTNATYIGLTHLEKIHTYGCKSFLTLTKTMMNLFSCSHSLIHGSSKSAIKLNGGSMLYGKFSNTHFEGCEPAVIEIEEGVFSSSFNFVDCSSEASGSQFGLLKLNGQHNEFLHFNFSGDCVLVPGNLDGKTTFQENCIVSAYTSKKLSIIAQGCYLETPENFVILDGDEFSYYFYSASKNNFGTNNRSGIENPLFGKIDRTTENIAIVPSGTKAWAEKVGGVVYKSEAFVPDVVDRHLVITSINTFEDYPNLSFSAASSYVIDDVYRYLYMKTVRSVPLDEEVVMVVLVKIKANEVLNRIQLIPTNVKTGSAGYATFEKKLDYSAMELAHPSRKFEIKKTIANLQTQTMFASMALNSPYYLNAELILNDGAAGVIKYEFSGKITNGSKVRVKNGTPVTGVTLVESDGMETDAFNIALTNETGSNLKAVLRVSY